MALKIENLELAECAHCIKLHGHPQLCVSCITNRTTIQQLQAEVRRLKGNLALIKHVVSVVGD